MTSYVTDRPECQPSAMPTMEDRQLTHEQPAQPTTELEECNGKKTIQLATPAILEHSDGAPVATEVGSVLNIVPCLHMTPSAVLLAGMVKCLLNEILCSTHNQS